MPSILTAMLRRCYVSHLGIQACWTFQCSAEFIHNKWHEKHSFSSIAISYRFIVNSLELSIETMAWQKSKRQTEIINGCKCERQTLAWYKCGKCARNNCSLIYTHNIQIVFYIFIFFSAHCRLFKLLRCRAQELIRSWATKWAFRLDL